VNDGFERREGGFEGWSWNRCARIVYQHGCVLWDQKLGHYFVIIIHFAALYLLKGNLDFL
jgi:hypothetical protein